MHGLILIGAERHMCLIYYIYILPLYYEVLKGMYNTLKTYFVLLPSHY